MLHGSETWSLALRESGNLGVFEKSVLRIIFGSKRDVLTREQIKFHNDKINILNSPSNTARMIKQRRTRLAGHAASMWGREVSTYFGGQI